jgi:signal transduction histidine kinase
MLMPTAATCFFIGGETLPLLGALAVVYCAYLIRAGLEHGRTQSEALRLRFERTALVDDLRSARDAAEAANRAKSEFLANMSHELRTPLNAILGFSEIIKLKVLGPDATARHVEYAGLIHQSGSHLLALINDLLDVSKAEAGKIELEKEPVEIGALVDSCVRLIGPTADKAGVRLDLPAQRVPVMLFADGRKLRQILLNLLSNAMKFTPAGGVVSIAYAATPEGGVTLTVSDTGIGMTPAQQQRAMEPFVQVAQDYVSDVQGTGLGLPLTKKLAELHGGRLEMTSAPAEGTTITIHLPPARHEDGVAETAATAAAADTAAARRVAARNPAA